MTVQELLQALTADQSLHVMLPDGDFVPAHFHVTEVGRVQKDFVGCGGTKRQIVSCLIQVWVTSDINHRLKSDKLAAILNIAKPMLGSTELPVEIEYETNAVSQYPLSHVESTPAGLLFHLVSKHTECLAPDRCGVGQGCC